MMILEKVLFKCRHLQTRRSIAQVSRIYADHLIPASDAAPRRGRLRTVSLCLAVDSARTAVGRSTTLPDELRNSDSFNSFKRFLKTTL